MSDTPTQAGETKGQERASSDAILLSALGYIPLMFFLPLFTGNKEPFAKFHGRQSLVMFALVVVFNIAVGITDLVLGKALGGMFFIGYFFKAVAWLIHYPAGFLVAVAYSVLVVVGIVQAANGNYWRIPVVGVFAERLKF